MCMNMHVYVDVCLCGGLCGWVGGGMCLMGILGGRCMDGLCDGFCLYITVLSAMAAGGCMEVCSFQRDTSVSRGEGTVGSG